MKDPERLDLPSASGFEADALCPGRQQMVASLPREKLLLAPTDEEADRGTRIHTAFETENTLDLDEEDLEIYTKGRRNEELILKQWLEDFNLSLSQEGKRELRLWLNDPATGEPLTSAKLDKHWIADDRLLIIDLKSLWAVNLTPAERNYQLRVQAVVAAREYDATHVRVAFNKALWAKSDVVDYTKDHLEFAERNVLAVLWETRQPGARRNAGAWCRYCPAKPWCPEAGALSLLPSSFAGITRAPEDFDADTLVRQLTDEDRAFLWQRSKVIEKILESIKQQLKALPDKRLAQLGIGRKDGRNLDPIVNVRGLFDYLVTQGISEAELWSALSFGKTELRKALQRDQGWTGDKTAGYLKQVLEPFIEKKQAESSLVKL